MLCTGSRIAATREETATHESRKSQTHCKKNMRDSLIVEVHVELPKRASDSKQSDALSISPRLECGRFYAISRAYRYRRSNEAACHRWSPKTCDPGHCLGDVDKRVPITDAIDAVNGRSKIFIVVPAMQGFQRG